MAKDVHRFAAVLHNRDLLLEHTPVEQQPIVARSQILAGPVEQLALRAPEDHVADPGDAEDVLALVVFQRDLVQRDRFLRFDRDAIRRQIALIAQVPGVRIVDRDADLELLAESAAQPDHGRKDKRMALDPFLDLPAAGRAAEALHDPELEPLEGAPEARRLQPVPVRLGPRCQTARPLLRVTEILAAQVGVVGGIDRALHALEPVAWQDGMPDLAEDVVPDEHVPTRQQRGRERTQIGPNEPAELLRGVSGRANLILQGAVLGFEGNIQTASLRVEQPAGVGTAQALLLRDAVGERAQAVRTIQADQAETVLEVAIQGEVLTKDSQRLDRLFVTQLGRRSHGLPVSAHQLAHGRAAPDAAKELILFAGQQS